MRVPVATPRNLTRIAYAAALATATAAEVSAIRTKRLDDTITRITRGLTPDLTLRWFAAAAFWGWGGWHLLVENRGWQR